jgi:hypothetical protein
MDPMEEGRPQVLRLIPGGASPSKDELAVAGWIVGAVAGLYLLRKGLKGIGPIELVGSTASGLEFAGYLIVVGAALRTLQTHLDPESSVSRALSYIY